MGDIVLRLDQKLSIGVDVVKDAGSYGRIMRDRNEEDILRTFAR